MLKTWCFTAEFNQVLHFVDWLLLGWFCTNYSPFESTFCEMYAHHLPSGVCSVGTATQNCCPSFFWIATHGCSLLFGTATLINIVCAYYFSQNPLNDITVCFPRCKWFEWLCPRVSRQCELLWEKCGRWWSKLKNTFWVELRQNQLLILPSKQLMLLYNHFYNFWSVFAILDSSKLSLHSPLIGQLY